MGQDVYVLTSLIGEGKNREWRPVGVVTNLDTADQWVKSGNSNDWIPFELDDVSLTSAVSGNITPFRPTKPIPDQEKMLEYVQRLEATNQKLLGLVQQLQKAKRGAYNADNIDSNSSK